MTRYGSVHVLTVEGERGDPDYWVEHSDDCPYRDEPIYSEDVTEEIEPCLLLIIEAGKPTGGTRKEYDCGVAYELDNAGLDSLMDDALNNVESGVYKIRHWYEEHSDDGDYDGGLQIVKFLLTVWCPDCCGEDEEGCFDGGSEHNWFDTAEAAIEAGKARTLHSILQFRVLESLPDNKWRLVEQTGRLDDDRVIDERINPA